MLNRIKDALSLIGLIALVFLAVPALAQASAVQIPVGFQLLADDGSIMTNGWFVKSAIVLDDPDNRFDIIALECCDCEEPTIATVPQSERTDPKPTDPTEAPPTATDPPPTNPPPTDPPPTEPPPPPPTEEAKCNRGSGNGREGCDPGNSGGRPGNAGEDNE
jgi:hypothetical protein